MKKGIVRRDWEIGRLGDYGNRYQGVGEIRFRSKPMTNLPVFPFASLRLCTSALNSSWLSLCAFAPLR